MQHHPPESDTIYIPSKYYYSIYENGASFCNRAEQSIGLSFHKETSVTSQHLPEETEQLIKPINLLRSTVL